MLFLVRRCGELVSFSRFMYCLHSSLGRMGESGSQSGVQLVLQVVVLTICITFCLILEIQKMAY